MSLKKFETLMEDLKGEMTKLEKRTQEVEDRISATEDDGRRYERAICYLLRRERDLTARCEDLQNRTRRNNLRIYRVPEGSEGKDVKKFVAEMIQSVLKPIPDANLQIERAHRSLASKPKDPNATPRSLIVRFVDYSVKDKILRQAWSQKLMYKDEQIYFDHDHSPELQRKRAQVRETIKQLKTKNVKAKCLYPAQLKLRKKGIRFTLRSRRLSQSWLSITHIQRSKKEHRWRTRCLATGGMLWARDVKKEQREGCPL